MTIIGARPQFIKAAAFSRALKKYKDTLVSHIIVHTGQHYDEAMSDVFFQELEIGRPDYNLEIGSGSHGAMTGKMLERIESLILQHSPDWVLVYGDTNSTLAGALAAAKLRVKIAHVEAGLRSFNMNMPEEINRILTDKISTLLFCPTQLAVDNLHKEGISKGIFLVGDVMYDVAVNFAAIAQRKSDILNILGLKERDFILATCHRAENTDDLNRLTHILRALSAIAQKSKLVLPVHPRTKKVIEKSGMEHYLQNIIITQPVSYLDMVMLEKNAKAIITDSGGVQKEAFFYEVPCITTRDETEWEETVEYGWNILTGADFEKIMHAYDNMHNRTMKPCQPYGDGHAAEKILEKMLNANII